MRPIQSLSAAVVGTGFMGRVHIEALRRLGVRVVGVVGSSPDRATSTADSWPFPEPYTSFEAMLADNRVDVVHIATPNHLHFEQAQAVLAAGKHVICEKPLGVASSETAVLTRSGLWQRPGPRRQLQHALLPALSRSQVANPKRRHR